MRILTTQEATYAVSIGGFFVAKGGKTWYTMAGSQKGENDVRIGVLEAALTMAYRGRSRRMLKSPLETASLGYRHIFKKFGGTTR